MDFKCTLLNVILHETLTDTFVYLSRKVCETDEPTLTGSLQLLNYLVNKIVIMIGHHCRTVFIFNLNIYVKNPYSLHLTGQFKKEKIHENVIDNDVQDQLVIYSHFVPYYI